MENKMENKIVAKKAPIKKAPIYLYPFQLYFKFEHDPSLSLPLIAALPSRNIVVSHLEELIFSLENFQIRK